MNQVAAHWTEGTERDFSTKLRRNVSFVTLIGAPVTNSTDFLVKMV